VRTFLLRGQEVSAPADTKQLSAENRQANR
jgi:hypothetical protein